MKKLLKALLVCLLCVGVCACTNEGGKEPEPTPAVPDSDKAMENFAAKLEAGNYVMETASFKGVVSSPDHVYFTFPDGTGYGVVTLNGESFYGVLLEDSFQDTQYVSNKPAIDIAAEKLPNTWLDIAEGNLFNVFYGHADTPLEYITDDDNIKSSLSSIVNYGYAALALMHEVTMKFDAEDPTTVKITAVVDDNPGARIFYDDIDLTITFGTATEDERIVSWTKNPVYPDGKTAWEMEDLFYFNSVFLPGYGEQSVPFPTFASYALKIDDDVFNDYEKLLITDSQATEKDVEDYKQTLLNNGFETVEMTDASGRPVTKYRKLLREKYKCYALLYPYFADGFVLEGERYYDEATIYTLDEINSVIQDFGFAAIPENEHLTNWQALDTKGDRSESWLGFFDYELALVITVNYDSEEELAKFIEDYGKLLVEKGYHPEYNNAGEDEQILDRYSNSNGASVFLFYEGDGSVTHFMFRNERNYTKAEAEKMIADAGIPAPSLDGDIFIRNILPYHQYVRGFKGTLYLSGFVPFESVDAADKWLTDYVAVLDEADFLNVDPDSIGTRKNNAFYNEELDKFVSFNLLPTEDGASVSIDFVSNN